MVKINKKKYILMLITLEIFCFLDSLLTYIGLSKGFSEGNTFVVFLFTIFSVKISLILLFLISSLMVLVLYYIFIKYEDTKKFTYYFTLLPLLVRMMVVFNWIGLIF